MTIGNKIYTEIQFAVKEYQLMPKVDSFYCSYYCGNIVNLCKAFETLYENGIVLPEDFDTYYTDICSIRDRYETIYKANYYGEGWLDE